MTNEQEEDYHADDLCSSCGSLAITDSSTGELVCSSCGIVIKDKVETLSPEWRSSSLADNRARGGFPSSLLLHDTGLSTYIGIAGNSFSPKASSQQEDNNDAVQANDSGDNNNNDDEDNGNCNDSGDNNGDDADVYVHKASYPLPVNRLRKLNAMSISAPFSRNLKKATWEINRICSTLGLSWQLAERSAYFYRKALTKDLIKGRSISGFVVASIYLACKERYIPRTIDEVSRVAGIDKPFAAHCYKILLGEMHIEPPITDPFRNVAKISARAGIDERVSRRAREILSDVANHTLVMGKNPLVLAAAALYLATTEYRLGLTKTTIADAAEISTISLRKRLADIIQALGSKSCSSRASQQQ